MERLRHRERPIASEDTTGSNDARAAKRGPGRFFAEHPAVYQLSLAGAIGTAGYAAARASGARGGRRIPWAALGLLEVGIATGIVSVRRAALKASQPSPARDADR